MAVWPPSAPPMAHGLPGSVGSASVELFLPLRWVTPMGWIGGRYSTSKPAPATYGRRRSTSASVPWRPGSSDAEHGNVSYQALKRARGRSTTMGYSGEDPARLVSA